MTDSDKRLLKYIQQFKKRLEIPSETMDVDAEEEESENDN